MTTENPTEEDLQNADVGFRQGVMDTVIGGVNIGGLALAAHLGEPVSMKLLNNIFRLIEVFCADLAEKDPKAFEVWRMFLATGVEKAIGAATRSMVQGFIKAAREKDLDSEPPEVEVITHDGPS